MKILLLDSRGEVGNSVALENSKDLNGHGSLMRSVILSVNPNAMVDCYKIVDRCGTCSTDLFVSGLVFGYMNDYDIISISLALPYISKTMDKWLHAIYDKGTKIVVSSGNNLISPLGLHQCTISVGALDEQGNVADYTIGGYDVLAKGYFNDKSGTSIATAYYVGQLSIGGDDSGEEKR